MATTPHLHRKSDPKRGTVGVRLVLSMLTLFQHPPRGPLHCAKRCSKTYKFRDIGTQRRFLSAPMSLHSDFNAPLRTKSRNRYWKRVHACPKSSVAHPPKHQNHHLLTKSFVFSISKLAIPGRHDTSFASKVGLKARYGGGPAGPKIHPVGTSSCKKLQQNLVF